MNEDAIAKLFGLWRCQDSPENRNLVNRLVRLVPRDSMCTDIIADRLGRIAFEVFYLLLNQLAEGQGAFRGPSESGDPLPHRVEGETFWNAMQNFWWYVHETEPVVLRRFILQLGLTDNSKELHTALFLEPIRTAQSRGWVKTIQEKVTRTRQERAHVPSDRWIIGREGFGRGGYYDSDDEPRYTSRKVQETTTRFVLGTLPPSLEDPESIGQEKLVKVDTRKRGPKSKPGQTPQWFPLALTILNDSNGGISDAEIARRCGVSPSLLSKRPEWKQARQLFTLQRNSHRRSKFNEQVNVESELEADSA